MTPLLDDGKLWRVVHGDTLALLPGLPDASVDAVVCDPPYGIDLKGHRWDGRDIRRTGRDDRAVTSGQAFEAWTTIWARELHRVLKPGGHLVAFAAPRMAHRLTSGLEDAGLEIRDVLMWMFATGVPKSRRLAGGRGTTLKPFYEPIVLARRPLLGTVAQNLAHYGTGTLNVQDCAIVDTTEATTAGRGRWPANVAVGHHARCRPRRCSPGCPAEMLDAQRAGASRFLYCAKPSRRERDAGCDHLPSHALDLFPDPSRTTPVRRVKNPHPTVKPIELMRWLVDLITPTDGLVLDPFCGSGTTGIAAILERRRFVGIERDGGHVEIARARIAHREARQDA